MESNAHLFLKEALYLLGLYPKERGRLAVVPDSQAPAGSLAQVIKTALRRKNGLRKVANRKLWGATFEAQVNNATRELCVCFLGRMLLLKTLEGQLVQYHNDSAYQFLNPEALRNWKGYQLLFHEVMATAYEGRSPFLRAAFGYVPPLALPIFLPTKLEEELGWENLYASKKTLPIMNGSVMKVAGDILFPSYLAEWLQRYKFGTGQGEAENVLSADDVAWVLGQLGVSEREVMSLPVVQYQKWVQPVLASKVCEKVDHYFPGDELSTSCAKEALQDLAPQEAINVLQALKVVIPCAGQGVLHRAIIREWVRLVVDAGLLSAYTKGASIKQVTWNQGMVCLTNRRKKQLVYALTAGPGGLNRKAEPPIQQCFEQLFDLIKGFVSHNLLSVACNEAEAILCRVQVWLELMSVMPFSQLSELQELPDFPDLSGTPLVGDALRYRFRLDQELEQLLPDQPLRQQLYISSLMRYHDAKDKEARKEAYTMLQELNAKFRPVDPALIQKLRKIEHELSLAQNPLLETPDSAKKIARLNVQRETTQRMLAENGPYDRIEWRTDFPVLLDPISGSWGGADLILTHAPIEEPFLSGSKESLHYLQYFTFARQKVTPPISALYLELCLQLGKKGNSDIWVMLSEHHFAAVSGEITKMLFPKPLSARDWEGLDKEGVQWEWKIIQTTDPHGREAHTPPETLCNTF